MWYKKAQTDSGLKSFMPVPEPKKDDNETIGEIPDEPENPQQQLNPNQKLPPLHNWCHCKIISNPDGTQRWNHNPDACSECVDLAREFNQAQTMQNLQVIPESPIV